MLKWYAWVGPIPEQQESLGDWFPLARILIMDVTDNDGIYLYRFAVDGREGGDTWHETVEDAKHQAEFEYEGEAGDWLPVPEGVTDMKAFARSLLSQR